MDDGTHRPHAQQIEVLAAISRIFASQSGQEQMLAAVLQELERELGMARATVMLLSSDGSELFVGAAPRIDAADMHTLRYRLGEGIIGRVVQTGTPAIVPQVSEEPRFINRIHRRSQAEDVSFLCVPIVLGSEVVGALAVDMAAARPEQLQEHCRFLEIVASMIAYDVKARRAEAVQRLSLETERSGSNQNNTPTTRSRFSMIARSDVGTNSPVSLSFSAIFLRFACCLLYHLDCSHSRFVAFCREIGNLAGAE